MSEGAAPHLVVGCAGALGLTVSEMTSIAKTAPRRYFIWLVDKKAGGKRTLCHPARELKTAQYYFLTRFLYALPVHAAATAYVRGSSIKRNAYAHVSSRVILKLDLEDFFGSISSDNWREYARVNFASWSEDELEFSCRILFWGRRTYDPVCLAIGAPTSPIISNALMFEFDERMSRYSAKSGLVYTRYADDMTFSSQGYLNSDQTIEAVNEALAASRYTRLSLNVSKTRLVSNRVSRRVTGLVITPDRKVSLGRERKRLMSSMVHHHKVGTLELEDLPRLAGLLAFAQDIEPSYLLTLRRRYGVDVVDGIMRMGLIGV